MEKDQDFKVGDIVWAKIKGWPDWPAQILPLEKAPQYVLDSKHTPSENMIVHFFASRDFGWVSPSQLKSFQEHFESCYQPQSKRKWYQEGVALAKDPELRAKDEIEFKKLEQETLEAQKNKEKQKKRKSLPASSSLAKEESAKKRRQSMDLESKSKDKVSDKKKSSAIPLKEQKNSVSETDKCLRLRVKLQKFFQMESRTDQDYERAHHLMNEAEQLKEDYEMFKSTKIGKVVKLMSKMNLDKDEYDIKSRAQALLVKWRSALESMGSSNSLLQESMESRNLVKSTESLDQEPNVQEEELEALIDTIQSSAKQELLEGRVY